jgi:glycosyltransferase involved in cell wall biosynthesis
MEMMIQNFHLFKINFFRFSEKCNIKFANEVISVSKPDQQYILKKYNRDVQYIPNGITPSQFKFKKNKNDSILFAAGRIYHLKGLHLLIDAARKLNLEREIKIAGDMDQVNEYKAFIHAAAKGLNIRYFGLIKDKKDLMRIISESSVFVFPSLSEAMSIMLLEVVSMKTPVIASDIPANRAVFSDDEILFFKNNDTNDLAAKLQYAINNPLIMTEMANKAYEKLAENYNWRAIANKYKIIFLNHLG